MAMEVVTLRTTKRCSDCGKELPKGSQARMYRKGDGSVAFYCLNGHPRQDNRASGNQASGNRVASASRGVQPSANLSDAVSILSEILKTLQEIRSDIKALLFEFALEKHPESIIDDDEPSDGQESNETDEFPF